MGKINTDRARLIATTPRASGPSEAKSTEQASNKKTAARAVSPEVQNSKTPNPNPEPTASAGVGSNGPKYASLVPKEARLREDQIASLNDLARTLARNRTNKTERITSNTLIRIAIDKLLADSGGLTGETEDQLRDDYLAHG